MLNYCVEGKSRGDFPKEESRRCHESALPTKVRLVKTMVFPVVMYGCESWTIKKAEC